ncbi:MAG: AAA family ATPase [Clostridia bacterium]|nr:AAA family ATPase [Clostridia bacterium]
MERKAEKSLIEWMKNPARQPLVVTGARQAGKTWLIEEFASNYFSNCVTFTFEHNPQLCSIFKQDLNPERIIRELSVLSNTSIIMNQTLIFFDEIQQCPEAVTSLKYFREMAPEYYIIAAGSLIGVATLRKSISFPVGKVDELTMYPMDFGEFLSAVGAEPLKDMIQECFEKIIPMSETAHATALDWYRKYLVTGGMPAAVETYLSTGNFDKVRSVHRRLFSDYGSDMGKYASPAEAIRNEETYQSISAQLSRENKKFQYSLIAPDARSREYGKSVRWLMKAGLLLRCYRVTSGLNGCKGTRDLFSFKAYLSDVGLLSTQLNIPVNNLLTGTGIDDQVEGGLTENYVAQQLVANDFEIFYWTSENTAEVDLVIQTDEGVIPVECKTSIHNKTKSLMNVYIPKYNPPYSIRITAKNFGFANGIRAVPLYAAWCLNSKMKIPGTTD